MLKYYIFENKKKTFWRWWEAISISTKQATAFHRGNGKSSFGFTQVHNMVRINEMKYICNGKNRGARVMVLDATFNNISVLSWWSVLLVEETGVPKIKQRPVASHWPTSSHIVVSSIPHNFSGDRYWLCR